MSVSECDCVVCMCVCLRVNINIYNIMPYCSNIHLIHPYDVNVVKPIPAKVKAPKKGTKSPNLGKQEFSGKIGRRHFFPLVVNYLHAKNQRNS